MAVIKVTNSGKAILFIDDDGKTFVTSIKILQDMINASNPNKFVVITRLPGAASASRFPQSPVFNPEDKKVKDGKELAQVDDVFAPVKKEEKTVQDVLL
jgi:hypothetical protein